MNASLKACWEGGDMAPLIHSLVIR